MKKTVAAAFVVLLVGCVSLQQDKDLVYCCSFDSVDKIKTPAKGGPAEILGDIELRDGVCGKALVVTPQSAKIRVPFANGLPVDRGCIEFDAKMFDLPSSYGDGPSPKFFHFTILDERWYIFFLEINANDGAGRSGWKAVVGGRNLATFEHRFGSGSYKTLFGEQDCLSWHHYNISWDLKGLSSAKNKAILIKIDGKEILSAAVGTIDLVDFNKRMTSSLELLFNGSFDDKRFPRTKVPFLIDEFKVWSVPK